MNVNTAAEEPKKKKRTLSAQVYARVPDALFNKIKARADLRYQGKVAMVTRELILKAAEAFPWSS